MFPTLAQIGAVMPVETPENSVSPTTSQVVARAPSEDMYDANLTEAKIAEKRIILSDLANKVNAISKLIDELGTDSLKHEFNLNFHDVTAQMRQSLKEYHQRIRTCSSFYSFLMNTHLSVMSADLGYFGVLPLEIVMIIFSHLGPKELCRVAQVCRLWNALSNDHQLWKSKCDANWDTTLLENSKPDDKTWKWLYQCKVYPFDPKTHKDGRGRFLMPNGNCYEGEWRNCKRDGWGISRMSNRRVFCGQWKDDKRNGYGVFTWPGGDIYMGNWRDSKRSGNGKYTWADGREYDGEWFDDKRQGFGVSIYPDGRKYCGEYQEGKRNGKGHCFYPDSSKYDGEYRGNKRHGHGIFTWPNGDTYEGPWIKGRRVGTGRFTRQVTNASTSSSSDVNSSSADAMGSEEHLRSSAVTVEVFLQEWNELQWDVLDLGFGPQTGALSSTLMVPVSTSSPMTAPSGGLQASTASLASSSQSTTVSREGSASILMITGSQNPDIVEHSAEHHIHHPNHHHPHHSTMMTMGDHVADVPQPPEVEDQEEEVDQQPQQQSPPQQEVVQQIIEGFMLSELTLRSHQHNQQQALQQQSDSVSQQYRSILELPARRNGSTRAIRDVPSESDGTETESDATTTHTTGPFSVGDRSHTPSQFNNHNSNDSGNNDNDNHNHDADHIDLSEGGVHRRRYVDDDGDNDEQSSHHASARVSASGHGSDMLTDEFELHHNQASSSASGNLAPMEMNASFLPDDALTNEDLEMETLRVSRGHEGDSRPATENDIDMDLSITPSSSTSPSLCSTLPGSLLSPVHAARSQSSSGEDDDEDGADNEAAEEDTGAFSSNPSISSSSTSATTSTSALSASVTPQKHSEAQQHSSNSKMEDVSTTTSVEQVI